MALGAFFVSSFLKGVTGLGFSTVCLCLLATFIDLRLAIPLVVIPSFSSNILVMFQAGRFVDAVKRFWLLYLSALPGLMLGVLFLTSFRNDITKAILGVVILVYGVWGGRTNALRFPEKREKQLLFPVALGIFLGGLIRKKFSDDVYQQIVFLLLIVLGIRLVGPAFFEF